MERPATEEVNKIAARKVAGEPVSRNLLARSAFNNLRRINKRNLSN